LLLYRVGDCVMHLCPICNRHTRNVLDDDDDDTVQYLTELEYSGVNRNKEQSGRMLGHLISKAPQLIRPYMQPILAVLIPKLKEPDQNLGVVIAILTAIGDIALVCELLSM